MIRLPVAMAFFLLLAIGGGGRDCLFAHGHSDADNAEKPSPVSLNAGKDWVEEKTGKFIPLDSSFTDETGRQVTLTDIIDRPTILLPIYFYCPNSCSTNLANLATSLAQLKSLPGQDFRVVAFSFNEKETTDDAARAKKNYLKLAGKAFPEKEWLFLTGTKKAITALTAALGYRFQKMADQTYIHPSALVIAAGNGKIIRYVYGSFIAGDIDMAIADAANGTPSLSVKRLLGICFATDPEANTSIFQTVKVVVSVAFLAAIAAFLFFFRKRRRRS